MIKNKMALLGAAATLGVMGGAFVSPAQALTYTFDAADFVTTGGNTGSLTGSFEYSGGSYSNFNLTSTSSFIASQTGANPFSYSTGNYSLVDSSAGGFTLDSTVSPFQRSLVISFATSLDTTLGSVTNLRPFTGSTGSRETFFSNGQLSAAGLTGGTVTAVPWETDALSVIGATTLFGFGVWTKRKRKVDLSK